MSKSVSRDLEEFRPAMNCLKIKGRDMPMPSAKDGSSFVVVWESPAGMIFERKVPPANTKSPLGAASNSLAEMSKPGRIESLVIFPLLMNLSMKKQIASFLQDLD